MSGERHESIANEKEFARCRRSLTREQEDEDDDVDLPDCLANQPPRSQDSTSQPMIMDDEEGNSWDGGITDTSSPTKPPNSPSSSVLPEDITTTTTTSLLSASVFDSSPLKSSTFNNNGSGHLTISSPLPTNGADIIKKDATISSSPSSSSLPSSPTVKEPTPKTAERRCISGTAPAGFGMEWDTKMDITSILRGKKGGGEEEEEEEGCSSPSSQSASPTGRLRRASPTTPPRSLRVARGGRCTPPRAGANGSLRRLRTWPPAPVQKRPEPEDSQGENTVEKDLLPKLKNIWRHLTTTEHGLSILAARADAQPAGEGSTAVESFFSETVSKLAAEISRGQESLDKAELALEQATAIGAVLQQEKESLQALLKEKDAQIERVRKDADEARADRDRKDIEVQQQLRATADHLRQRDQEAEAAAASRTQVKDLQTMVAKLRERLKEERDTSAQMQTELEGGKWKRAIRSREHEEHDRFLEAHLEQLEKSEDEKKNQIERLEQERDELKREVFAAKREATTMLVGGERVSFKQYEKLLTNARGEISHLKRQLLEAKEEREMSQDIPLDDLERIVEPLLKIHRLPCENALESLSRSLIEEEEDLQILANEVAFQPYTHVVSEPEATASQTSSACFVRTRGDCALGMGGCESQGSQQSSPGLGGHRTLHSELCGFELCEDESMSSQIPLEDTQPDDTAFTEAATQDPSTVVELRVGLKQSMKKLQAEKKGCEEEIEQLKEEIEQLKKEIDQARADLANNHQQQQQQQSGSEHDREELAALQEHVNSLVKSLQEYQQQLAIAIDQRDAVQREIKEKQDDFETWQASGEEIGNINVALEQKITEKAYSLTASEARNRKLEAESVELHSKLRRAERRIIRDERKIRVLDADLESKSTQIELPAIRHSSENVGTQTHLLENGGSFTYLESEVERHKEELQASEEPRTLVIQTAEEEKAPGTDDPKTTGPALYVSDFSDGNYAWQVVLAVHECLQGHWVSWQHGLWFFLSVMGWIPARLVGKEFRIADQRPAPKKMSVFLIDLCWLYLICSTLWIMVKAMYASQAVKGVWEQANALTRAYFIESQRRSPRKILGLEKWDSRFEPTFSEVAGTVLRSVAEVVTTTMAA